MGSENLHSHMFLRDADHGSSIVNQRELNPMVHPTGVSLDAVCSSLLEKVATTLRSLIQDGLFS